MKTSKRSSAVEHDVFTGPFRPGAVIHAYNLVAPERTFISWQFEMGKPDFRYVAKSEPGKGWRVWNRKTNRWWGEWRKDYPDRVLAELNGPARPEHLVELCRRK